MENTRTSTQMLQLVNNRNAIESRLQSLSDSGLWSENEISDLSSTWNIELDNVNLQINANSFKYEN
jgi:hypothetical protein